MWMASTDASSWRVDDQRRGRGSGKIWEEWIWHKLSDERGWMLEPLGLPWFLSPNRQRNCRPPVRKDTAASIDPPSSSISSRRPPRPLGGNLVQRQESVDDEIVTTFKNSGGDIRDEEKSGPIQKRTQANINAPHYGSAKNCARMSAFRSVSKIDRKTYILPRLPIKCFTQCNNFSICPAIPPMVITHHIELIRSCRCWNDCAI